MEMVIGLLLLKILRGALMKNRVSLNLKVKKDTIGARSKDLLYVNSIVYEALKLFSIFINRSELYVAWLDDVEAVFSILWYRN